MLIWGYVLNVVLLFAAAVFSLFTNDIAAACFAAGGMLGWFQALANKTAYEDLKNGNN